MWILVWWIKKGAVLTGGCVYGVCMQATATFNRNLQTVERKIASVEENAGGSKEELEHQLGLVRVWLCLL